MRHHSKIKKFGREKNQRKALMRSLARNLIRHDRITTTEAKAKALRPFVEKLVTKAKNGTLASRRLASSEIHGAAEVKKLFSETAPRYKERAGGYTRIVKMPRRDLDGAPMAMIEFV